MSDKIPVFSTFGKTTNDFFTKGFPSTHKLEVTTKEEKGLTFVGTAEKKEKKDGTPYILGKIETKYKCAGNSGNKLEFTGTVDTDNLIKGDVSVQHSSLPGFKLILKPQTGKSQEVTGGFEYQNPNVSVSSSVLYKTAGDLSVTGTLVGGQKGVSLGLESTYTFARSTKTPVGLDSVKGLVNYKTSTLDVSFYARQQYHLEDEKKEGSPPPPSSKFSVGGSYEHKPVEHTTLHSTVEYDASKPSDYLSCTFGGAYKLDSQTNVQAKFSTDGKLTFHLAKELTEHLKTTATSEFNTFDLGGTNHKLAIGVLYKA